MELDRLFKMNKEKLKSYVDSLILSIESTTKHEERVGFEHTPPHKGIIDKDTMITNVDSTFRFTNNDYAYLFVEGLVKYNIHDLGPAMNYVYYFIRNYFGLDGNFDNRERLLSSNLDEYSIDSLFRKNAAVCAERAAMAQNLMSILGIESYYMIGQINDENHAYNIINYKGDYYLFDSSKDIPVYENNKIKDYRAYVIPISYEQVDILFNRGEISLPGGRTYKSFGQYESSISK